MQRADVGRVDSRTCDNSNGQGKDVTALQLKCVLLVVLYPSSNAGTKLVNLFGGDLVLETCVDELDELDKVVIVAAVHESSRENDWCDVKAPE